ncbi:CWF19-like protein 2 homolog [Calliphora vicina]|uniref:CWF19-like protein 2 homolog n=1 Tax=Calliphora vicina TaxID=7373 RepID=UPI00325B94C6
MSFIQFESAREKDKARQDLREAREHMLDEVKKRAEQRAAREADRLLKGETNWMLPSVEEKLKKKNKEVKKSKKDKKKSKKSKKKSNKKRKYSSSEEESDSDSTSNDSDGSSSNDGHKKSKKSKKSKKKHKKGSKNKRTSSCDTDSEDSGDEKSKFVQLKKSEEPLQRDNWMTDALMLKTYSRERVENKPNEKQQIDSYDPAKSSRELNPYWKTTGTGLPAFQKPKDDDDYKTAKSEKSIFSQSTYSSKGWKKQSDEKVSNECLLPQRKKSLTPSDDGSSSSEGEHKKGKEKSSLSASEFLTDQQMNELGAKILKAEIMGNMSLADELREKLEKARTQRNIFKERKKSAYLVSNSNSTNGDKCSKKKDEHILLTHTDQTGHTRPLQASKVLDPRDLYGGKKKQKQKRVNTHDESGERVRYFADDDRYDLKHMFESEKYTSASDANLQFANIAGKHKNPNDDMEDIFAEKICQDDSVRSERKDRDRAIREHQKVEAALDNCDKCFDSMKIKKELLICVGENVYLALPWYQGLQPGHCMIIPNQHATCCTQIDEDIWAEVNDFRKALTRMFASQHKDVIFFEIANRLHKRPHLVIHCIPIRESDGEMAPFYFKKAIEESEHEWSVNKQLVSLRQKSLRNSIPKGLPYFWVNFGMDTGFAHVIEDEERFPPNFAQEIIGGMLNLDANRWRRLQKEQNIITKVKMFADWWKKYDCTK